MSKAYRRKNKVVPAQRHPGGKLKQPTRAQLEAARKAEIEAARRAIVGVAVNQPHRRGDDTPRVECALGRFLKARKGRDEYWHAGQEYARLIRTHRRLVGIPGVLSNGPGLGHVADDDKLSSTIDALRRDIRNATSAMRPRDYRDTRWVCVDAGPLDDVDLADEDRCRRIEWGLWDLAIHFGYIKRPQRAA